MLNISLWQQKTCLRKNKVKIKQKENSQTKTKIKQAAIRYLAAPLISEPPFINKFQKYLILNLFFQAVNLKFKESWKV